MSVCVCVCPNVCLSAGVRACEAMFAIVFVCDGCVNVCVCVKMHFFSSIHPCEYEKEKESGRIRGSIQNEQHCCFRGQRTKKARVRIMEISEAGIPRFASKHHSLLARSSL